MASLATKDEKPCPILRVDGKDYDITDCCDYITSHNRRWDSFLKYLDEKENK